MGGASADLERKRLAALKRKDPEQYERVVSKMRAADKAYVQRYGTGWGNNQGFPGQRDG